MEREKLKKISIIVFKGVLLQGRGKKQQQLVGKVGIRTVFFLYGRTVKLCVPGNDSVKSEITEDEGKDVDNYWSNALHRQ